MPLKQREHQPVEDRPCQPFPAVASSGQRSTAVPAVSAVSFLPLLLAVAKLRSGQPVQLLAAHSGRFTAAAKRLVLRTQLLAQAVAHNIHSV